MTTPLIKIIDSFPDPHAVKYDENLWYKQHDKSLVVINCESKNIYYPKHWTPLSIKCAFNGTERYHFEKNSISVSDKNFLILNEGTEYSSSIQSETPIKSFTLNFTVQNIKEVFNGISFNAINQLDNPFKNYDGSPRFIEKLYSYNKSFANRLFTIKNAAKNKERDHSSLVELFYFVLGDMIMLYNKTNIEIDQLKAKKRVTREELYKRLCLAKDYIDSCYNTEISLHELSQLCFMNSFYLLREFKKAFKITPHQYLVRKRLTEGRNLLLSSDKSVNEITELVGFQDISSFSKLFKKFYGYPPGSNRKCSLAE